jgi:hypothetical protein
LSLPRHDWADDTPEEEIGEVAANFSSLAGLDLDRLESEKYV